MAWGKYNLSFNLQSYQDYFAKFSGNGALETSLLAFEDEQLIAMASLTANDGLQSEFSPWLANLYIKQEYRGKGIARKLCKMVEEMAVDLGYSRIYLLAYEQELRQMYEKFGYQFQTYGKVRDISVLLMNKDICKYV